MKNKVLSIALLFILIFPTTFLSKAEGISVDAGLTPAQDRIIVRLQYRNLRNRMNGNDIVMHMTPIVVVYGLSPDITIMIRNVYRAIGTNESMMEMDNRWMDPFLMGKVKLFRHNDRNYNIGVAGFAGTTFPILKNSISKTYNPVLGINASYRPGLWSFDLNNVYEWLNYNIKESNSSARQLQINLAISRNVIIQGLGNWVLAPVQEFSFVRNNPNEGDSSSFGFISPGFQLVSPHLKFEGLYQIAVNSDKTTGVRNGNRLIIGLRFMF